MAIPAQLNAEGTYMAEQIPHMIETHDTRERRLRVHLEKILQDNLLIAPKNQLALAEIDLDQVRTYLDREEEQWVSFREDSLQRAAATFGALQMHKAGSAPLILLHLRRMN